MKVSVIIPVFNGEETIIRAVDSVLQQETNWDFEIIIVNDCSNDGTLDLLSRYEKNEKVSIINNSENIGVNKSRNKAIHLSKGEYIAFLDSDDIWNLNKLDFQVSLLDKNHKTNLCFSNFSIYDENDGFICTGFSYWSDFRKMVKINSDSQVCKNIFSVILKENVICTSTVMVRRNALLSTDLFQSDFKYSQDWVLWLKLAKNNSFVFTNQILAGYYMIESSITRQSKTKHELINIVKSHKKNCNLRAYIRSKANCYAFMGHSAFNAKDTFYAHKYYWKSFSHYFVFRHFKDYLWQIFK